MLRVDEHEHRDLLWGLRGGGGNFGVVTVFEYRVDPVGPIVLGGNLVYPADRGLEVISAWQELVDSASDDLGTGIHFYVMPDIPYVPAELRNQPVVSIFVCHAGTVEEAEREIAPLRELAPAADMLEPMPYTTVQALSDAVLPPGQRNYWKAENLTDLTTAGISALISGAVDLAVTSPLGVVALYPKGRAITRVDGDSAALDGRASPYSVYAWSLWPSAEDDELNIGRTRALFRGIAEHLDTGVSANFSSEQDAAGFQQSFGRAERYQRLVDLKRRFDPENVFHLNHNIDPAAALQPAGTREARSDINRIRRRHAVRTPHREREPVRDVAAVVRLPRRRRLHLVRGGARRDSQPGGDERDVAAAEVPVHRPRRPPFHRPPRDAATCRRWRSVR